jgi:outer membrane receptor for Fe3+-dicitrate
VDGLILDLNTTLQKHQYDEFKKTTSGPDAKLGTADDVVVDYKGNWILRQPQFLLNGGLTYDKKSWELGVMFNYEGKRFADDQNLVELPAYGLVSARLGKTFAMQGKQSIKLGLNVYNVANSRGLAEGDPRIADTSVVANDPFYNARPVLPRRLTAFLMFKF